MPFKFARKPKINRKKHAKQDAERAGRIAEWCVLIIYILKGYWPLARRYKTPFGELDLILRKGRQIVCVEVKFRRAEAYEGYGLPAPAQIKRLKHTMAMIWPSYQAKNMTDIRLDIVVLYGWQKWKYFQNC